MTFWSENAGVRDRDRRAGKTHIIAALRRWIAQGLKRRPRIPHIRSVNARLGRDIGMSEAEIARHNIELPSQGRGHPML